MTRRPRYNAHPDANQPTIVKKLRQAHFWVINVSRWLSTPDLFVCGYDARRQERRWTAWEIKTTDGKLTQEQQDTLEAHAGDLYVARCVDDILSEYGHSKENTP